MVKAKSKNRGDSGAGGVRIAGRQCGKRAAFLTSLWKYLTADCYMYAPLLCAAWPGEAVDHRKGGAEPVRKKSKLKITRCVHSTGPRVLSKPSGDVLLPVSQSTFAYLNVQHAVTTPDAHERASSRDKEPLELDNDDPSLYNEDSDDETTSASEEAHCLERHEAEQVVNKLLAKFGGSFSKQLGIEIVKGDQEVEKWFLAVALFSKSSSLSVSTETFKNVLASGISNVGDTLAMPQEQLAQTLEKAGHDSYSERTAVRLRRLATQVKTEHGGSVCSLKSLTDPSELSRQLHSLFGLSSGSVRIFLRELRGVWPAASSELNSRAKNAARHLHLSLEAPSADVEAALHRLGQSHARHYRDCPGGSQCAVLLH